MTHYVRQIKGGSNNLSSAVAAMIANGADNTILSGANNAFIAGNSNSVSAASAIALGNSHSVAANADYSVVLGDNNGVNSSCSSSIVLGSYGQATAANSIVISAPVGTSQFDSRVQNGMSLRLPGDLDTTGLTANTDAGFGTGARASLEVSVNILNASAGDTLTIDGVTITAVSGTRTSGSNNFSIDGPTSSDVADDIVACINDSVNNVWMTAFATSGPGSGVVTIAYYTPGTVGNGKVVSTSNASAFSISNGGVMAGGSSGIIYKSMYVQGNDDIDATNYMSLVEVNQWVGNDYSSSSNERKILTMNYMPIKSADWTGLSVLDPNLANAPNNVATALDSLARGLLASQPSVNLFVHTLAANGAGVGTVVFNTGAPDIDGTEDILLGKTSFGATGKLAGLITTKGSLVAGDDSNGAHMNYANIGLGVLGVGLDVIAKGDYSAALGSYLNAQSSHNMLFGESLTTDSSSANSVAIGKNVDVTGSVGSFVLADAHARTSNALMSSQSHHMKQVFFNGFSRSSGLDSAEDAFDSALTDTVSNEGAREVFRPLHADVLALGANAIDNVFTLTTSHFAHVRGFVILTNGTDKALYEIADGLYDSTATPLNYPTIALLQDSSASWSAGDVDIAVSAGNMSLTINTPATGWKANAVLYISDLFA